jgi:hypothetical protein
MAVECRITVPAVCRRSRQKGGATRVSRSGVDLDHGATQTEDPRGQAVAGSGPSSCQSGAIGIVRF